MYFMRAERPEIEKRCAKDLISRNLRPQAAFCAAESTADLLSPSPTKATVLITSVIRHLWSRSSLLSPCIISFSHSRSPQPCNADDSISLTIAPSTPTQISLPLPLTRHTSIRSAFIVLYFPLFSLSACFFLNEIHIILINLKYFFFVNSICTYVSIYT